MEESMDLVYLNSTIGLIIFFFFLFSKVYIFFSCNLRFFIVYIIIISGCIVQWLEYLAFNQRI